MSLLVVMGSGETAPTMVKVHREVFAQSAAAAGGGPAVMLDTPFGFQMNADDLVARTQAYFADSVGTPVEVARWRRGDQPTVDAERALALLHRASWAFAGPGSPTYALRQWVGHRRCRRPCSTSRRAAARSSSAPRPPARSARTRSRSTRSTRSARSRAGRRASTCIGRLTGIECVVVPALRQRRGRRPRHPVLLPRRAAAASRSRRTCPTRSGSSASTSTPRCVVDLDGPDGAGRRQRPGHRAASRLLADLPGRRRAHARRARRPAARRGGRRRRRRRTGRPHAGRRTGRGTGAAAAPQPRRCRRRRRRRGRRDLARGRRRPGPASGSTPRSPPRTSTAASPRSSTWSRRSSPGAPTPCSATQADRARRPLRALVVRLGELAHVGARDPRERGRARSSSVLLEVRGAGPGRQGLRHLRPGPRPAGRGRRRGPGHPGRRDLAPAGGLTPARSPGAPARPSPGRAAPVVHVAGRPPVAAAVQSWAVPTRSRTAPAVVRKGDGTMTQAPATPRPVALGPWPQRMVNPIRAYDWGSTTALARMQGRTRPAGPRPSSGWAPTRRRRPGSRASDGIVRRLDALVEQAPRGGARRGRAAIFGARLPFLLKVLGDRQAALAAGAPDRRAGRPAYAGEARSPASTATSTPSTSPSCVYALEPIDALCGFRPADEAARLLGLVDRDRIRSSPCRCSPTTPTTPRLEDAFAELVTWPERRPSLAARRRPAGRAAARRRSGRRPGRRDSPSPTARARSSGPAGWPSTTRRTPWSPRPSCSTWCGWSPARPVRPRRRPARLPVRPRRRDHGQLRQRAARRADPQADRRRGAAHIVDGGTRPVPTSRRSPLSPHEVAWRPPVARLPADPAAADRPRRSRPSRTSSARRSCCAPRAR